MSRPPIRGLFWLCLLVMTVLAVAASPGGSSAMAQSPAKAESPDASAPRIVANQSHATSVQALSLSADGRLLASVDGSETAKFWDVAAGRMLRSFYAGLETRLSLIALSPDGRRVAAAMDRGGLVVWDTSDGREILNEPVQDGEVHWALWSPDGRLLVLGGHATKGDDASFYVSVLDAAKLDDPATFGFLRDYRGSVIGKTTAAFLRDGKRIAFSATEGGSHQLKLWDVTAGGEPQIVNVASEHLVAGADGTIAVSNFRSVDLFDGSGKPLRTTQAVNEFLASIFFSADGKTVYGLDYKDTLHVWDVASGRLTGSLKAPVGMPPLKGVLKPLPDGRHALATQGSGIVVRDLKTGAVVRSIGQDVHRIFSLSPRPDPRQVLAGGVGTLASWDITAGRYVGKLDVGEGGLNSVQASADGARLLLGYSRRLMRLVDAASGSEVARVTDEMRPLTSEQQKDPIAKSLAQMTANVNSMSFAFALSRDGALAAHGRNDGLIRIFATTGGPKLLGVIEKAHGESKLDPRAGEPLTAIAFSLDGGLLASAGIDSKVRLWDARTRKLVREISGHTWTVMSMVFHPDGKRLITGSGDRSIMVWDVATGQSTQKIQAHDGVVKAIALSPDGALLASAGSEGVVKVWDLVTGRLLHTLVGHVGEVTSVGVSRDGKRILSGGDDANLKVWHADTGKLLATFIAAANGEWLVMTPDGFFSASRAGAALLTIVRGFDVTTIDQVHQSLYNPDLVREALAGDPGGEVKAAAAVVNLNKVLESGPAPRVTLKSPAAGASSSSATVTAVAEIADQGKGIGRVEWRINGVTAAVVTPRTAGGRMLTLSQQLAVDAGDNVIEVVAYNASNVLASTTARTTVKVPAQAQAAKPRLHILAIGINGYTDKGWTPPGQDKPTRFGPLSLAVKDAETFAQEMRRASAGLYGDVRVEVVTEAKATRDGLEAAIAQMAAGVDRRDTFVLFAAAHGYSHDNRFYLIPSDYQGGTDPAALAARAIGQDRLQDWLSNRIKARRALVLLDTCESGALVAGYRRARTDAAAAEATVGRLHEATGRPVLAAAAQGQFAHEGVVAGSGSTHGIFTWALLDALRKGDRNGNGTIELSEIVAHVQDEVPKLAAKLGGLARSATAAEPVFGEQTARFGSRGEDFALVRKLQ